MSAPARCHLCHGEGGRYVFQGALDKFGRAMGRTEGVDYYFCSRCTVLFQHPIFNATEYQQFYEKVQRSDETGYDSDEVPQAHLDKKQRDTAFKWRLLELMNVPAMLPGKRVYEVGAGEGTLLASFRDRGYSVGGVEPLAPYARYAHDKLQLDVTHGYFDEAVAAREKPDFVIFDNVLEHLLEPEKMLQLVRRMINPNGVIYVAVPSAEVATWMNANISHITLWTRRALAFALTCAGFQPLAIVLGRPTSRPDEWVCVAQATGEPRDIQRESPHLYPAVSFDELSARWGDVLAREARAREKIQQYGPTYLLLKRAAQRVRNVLKGRV